MKNNLDEYSNSFMDQVHEIVFAIMCDVDEYCKANGITYFLSGGTCLGAVRHKGFIPWDHDGDLMMPRKDYERFLVGFKEAFKEKYGVGSLITEKKWVRQYAKIWDLNTRLTEKKFNEMERGISLDVFPIDGLPKNAFLRKIYYLKIKILAYFRIQMLRKVILPEEKCKIIKKMLSTFPGERGSRFLARQLDNAAKKYDFDMARYVGVSLACHYWDKETIEKEYMESAVLLPFEGRMFPVVNGYDRYLTNLYGNYMTVSKKMADEQERFVSGWDVEFDTSKMKR